MNVIPFRMQLRKYAKFINFWMDKEVGCLTDCTQKLHDSIFMYFSASFPSMHKIFVRKRGFLKFPSKNVTGYG